MSGTALLKVKLEILEVTAINVRELKVELASLNFCECFNVKLSQAQHRDPTEQLLDQELDD